MKIVSIIQARMNSNRLPGKVLMRVDRKPMIGYLVDRLKKIKKIEEIIISTTKNKKDRPLINFCKRNKIKFYRGSEKNVLKRVYETAKLYKADVILFITGDCPIIDIKIINKVLNYFLKYKKKFDYVGNAFLRSFPDGMDVHVFHFKTLEKNFKMVNKRLEKEHVTLGIKNNSKKFKIKNLIAPKKLFWPELGLTLDEREDFILIRNLILHFKKQKKLFFDCKNIIDLLKYKKAHWVDLNSHIIRKGDN